MRKSNGIVYRTTANGAQPPAARANTAAPMGHDDSDALARAIGEILVVTRRELRAEYAKALAKRDRKIERLEAQIEMLVRLVGGDKAKNMQHVLHGDSVVDLPKNFLRRVHNG